MEKFSLESQWQKMVDILERWYVADPGTTGKTLEVINSVLGDSTDSSLIIQLAKEPEFLGQVRMLAHMAFLEILERATARVKAAAKTEISTKASTDEAAQ